MRTLPSSAGWNPSGPICTQSLAPLIVSPIPGTVGSSKRTRPSRPIVYVYASSIRASRTTISVSANAPSPTTIHVACSAASPPDNRKIIANPSPTRTAAVGKSAGSARGANTRITRKAAT